MSVSACHNSIINIDVEVYHTKIVCGLHCLALSQVLYLFSFEFILGK